MENTAIQSLLSEVWVTDLKSKNKKLSLRSILFISLTAFSIIIVALLWIFQSVFLKDFYKEIKLRDVNSALSYVAENIYEGDIAMTVAEISNKNDVSISVYDESFELIASANAHEAGSIFKNLSANQVYGFYSEAAATEEGYFSQSFSGFGEKNDDEIASFIAVQLVKVENNNTYTIIAHTEITPVQSIVRTLRYVVLAASALIIIIAFITAIILSKRITKPIKKISSEAEELAKGKYDEVQFSSSAVKEVSELSESMNYMKTELGKIDSLQKELIANISHDLRTPLTLITGYAEMMQDLPNEITDENLQVIVDEGKRMTSLVSDALDISKLNAGVTKFNPERIDLIQCINSVMPQYGKLLEAENLKIIIDTGSIDKAYVMADRTRLLQAIYNLVNNAINYAGEDNTIIIKTEAQGEYISVHIIDHGEGISPESLDNIWDRYYKVDKSHKRAKAGSGLGLSIVKSVLTQTGAEYGVKSEPGKGSDFWFKLKTC